VLEEGAHLWWLTGTFRLRRWGGLRMHAVMYGHTPAHVADGGDGRSKLGKLNDTPTASHAD
jgi:hypothetical protein